MLPLSSPKKIHPKKTGIWAELERHLTVFITCQRHIGVLHTKEQVRVHNNICHLSTGIRVLGFPLYSERAFDFLLFLVRSSVVFQDTNTKPRQPQARSHTHSNSSPRCDWVRGGNLDRIFGRGRNCRNIGWPLLLFSLVWLSYFPFFFFFLLSLSFASDNKRNMQQCTTARQERTGTETLDS